MRVRRVAVELTVENIGQVRLVGLGVIRLEHGPGIGAGHAVLAHYPADPTPGEHDAPRVPMRP